MCGHWAWSKGVGVVKGVVTFWSWVWSKGVVTCLDMGVVKGCGHILVMGVVKGRGQGCGHIFVMGVAIGRGQRVWSLAVIKRVGVIKGVVTC